MWKEGEALMITFQTQTGPPLANGALHNNIWGFYGARQHNNLGGDPLNYCKAHSRMPKTYLPSPLRSLLGHSGYSCTSAFRICYGALIPP